jgi:predicted esterase
MKTFVLSLLAVLTFAAPASAAKKPELVVVSGKTSLSGTTISGSFVIRNKGRRRAGQATALLQMGAPGFADQVIANVETKPVKPGKRRTVTVTGEVPGDFKPNTYTMTACADPDGYVTERNENNNCTAISKLTLAAPPVKAAPKTPAGPVEYADDQPLQLESGEGSYWAVVPAAYKASTATNLLVWLHGCGGESGGDIYTVAPTGNRDYIAISVGGRDGVCWDVNQDAAMILAAIDNVESHFNIDPKRVVIGGFSSGGDMAYRTAFDNSTRFAGLLAVGTTPFRDTARTEADAAAAAFKFNVVHLAHTEDEGYPIDTVRKETDALKAAGFPVERVERPGAHYDERTDADLMAVLLPHMNDNWKAP